MRKRAVFLVVLLCILSVAWPAYGNDEISKDKIRDYMYGPLDINPYKPRPQSDPVDVPDSLKSNGSSDSSDVKVEPWVMPGDKLPSGKPAYGIKIKKKFGGGSNK